MELRLHILRDPISPMDRSLGGVVPQVEALPHLEVAGTVQMRRASSSATSPWTQSACRLSCTGPVSIPRSDQRVRWDESSERLAELKVTDLSIRAPRPEVDT